MTPKRSRFDAPAVTLRARGFSLIELLIATLIGLIVLAGVGSIFVGSKRGFSTQEGMGQVQESGRFLNYLMFPYVRLAGYLPDPRLQINPDIFFVPGGSLTTDTRRALWGVQGPGALGTTGTATAAGVTYARDSDVLVIRYMGQDAPGGAAADGSFRTCRGLPAAPSLASAGIRANQMAENVFFISRSGDTTPDSLSCRATIYSINPVTGAAAVIDTLPTQPLLVGVQSMQLLYGVDTNPADDIPPPPADPGLFPNEYFTADLVPNWTRVVAVRVAITTVSAEQTEGAAVNAGGTTDDDFVDANRRLQRVFTSTLLIRNRLRV